MQKTRSLPKAESLPLVMTVGYSTHTLEEFIHLLKAHGVSWLAIHILRLANQSRIG